MATRSATRSPDSDVPHVVQASDGRRAQPVPTGTLMLAGGACTADGEVLRCFVEALPSRSDAPVVALTVASANPAASARTWRATFRKVGAAQVRFPAFDRHDAAVDDRVAGMVRNAEGVFLGGGDQVTLVAALSGTHTGAAIRECYRKGGVVFGTSAGAAALSELTMAGGEIDEEGNLVEQYIGPGLGLLGHGAIIDTHFSQRQRLKRLFFVIASNVQLLGLGIDEDTALIVRGEIGEVVGAGGVTFVDGRDTVRYDNAATLEAGRQLTLSHLRVGIVGTHYKLNLRARELQDLLRE